MTEPQVTQGERRQGINLGEIPTLDDINEDVDLDGEPGYASNDNQVGSDFDDEQLYK